MKKKHLKDWEKKKKKTAPLISINDFTELIKEIRKSELALGSREYKIPDFSHEELTSRRSIYASKPIKKGDVFTSANLKCVRPGHGLSPIFYEKLIGLISNRNIEFGERITLSDLKE